MNPIISDLIQELESSPHKVATKSYVLNRLRESQRLDNAKRSPLEVIPFESLKKEYVSSERGGDINGHQEKIQIQRSQRQRR